VMIPERAQPPSRIEEAAGSAGTDEVSPEAAAQAPLPRR